MNELMGRFLEIPVAASAHAGEIDRMTILTHWLMAILFVGWGAFFVYHADSLPAGAHPKADYQGVKSHLASYIEWAVAAHRARADRGVRHSRLGGARRALSAESEATVVRVVAEQFHGTFIIPAPTGSSAGPTEARGCGQPARPRSYRSGGEGRLQLHQPAALPVNKPVIIHLSSKDVLLGWAPRHLRLAVGARTNESPRTHKTAIETAAACDSHHVRERRIDLLM